MANALDALRKAGKIVGYIRVSSTGQNTARQLDGVYTDKTFTDHFSGKSRERPQLKACLDYIREDDTLVVHSMDRLARNVEDLRNIVRELVGKGVTVTFVKENITFKQGGRSIVDDLILTLLGAFAEFERAIALERQREGIEKAKAAGVYRGRRPSLTKEKMQALWKMDDEGKKKTEMAKAMKISRQRVYHYLAQRPGKEVQHDGANQQTDA